MTDGAVEAKADKMKKKTEDMRRMFNLPDTESVIQDYSCAMRRAVLVPGRMFISQNYVCFYASLPEIIESVPFRKVTDIVQDRTALLFNNAINIISATGTLFFGSFVHRDETFNLLVHLWKHPPSYIDIDETPRTAPAPSSAASPPSNNPRLSMGPNKSSNAGSGNPFENSSSSSDPAGSRRSTYGGNGASQQQQQVKVDTESSRAALRIALETREIGAATMSELSYQAEVIDLIERDVENIHNNLDKSDRLVRGIESFGGSLANAFSSNKGSGRDVQYTDRTLVSARIETPVEIHILWKLSNDDLVPALVRFTNERFTITNPAPNKKEKDLVYTYEGIDSLQVRARPLHLDIRFKDKKVNRFRLMSSYVQQLVNEFCLRCKPRIGEVAVVFEPGTRKFAFGKASIPPPSNEVAGEGRKAAFFRRDGAAQLPGAFKGSSAEIQAGIMQQEEDLNQISGVLGDLHGMATTMTGEIVRQTEQLDRVTVRVDLANDRTNRTNQRVKDML